MRRRFRMPRPVLTGLGPLKAAAEKLGKVDFTNLSAGQALARLSRLRRKSPVCYTAG
jgi:hypothetical protein